VPAADQMVSLTISYYRPHRSFDQLLEKVCSHGLGLFTKIGDTELAVFSSKLLTPQDQSTFSFSCKVLFLLLIMLLF
jgi:hypothetical protein